MASLRRVELLLTATIDNLGIVGDIVKVRTGYARNYLLPMGLAEVPTQEKVDSLQEARAAAIKDQEALESQQAGIIESLAGVTLTLVRAANDQGGLYGSVTQRDISDALAENGFAVDTRAVRLHQAIRIVGEHEVTIQFGTDLSADIEILVESDRPLEDREEMEFDNEGNLIMRPKSAAPPPEAPEVTETSDSREGAEAPAEEEPSKEAPAGEPADA